jgi:hypothetical protein
MFVNGELAIADIVMVSRASILYPFVGLVIETVGPWFVQILSVALRVAVPQLPLTSTVYVPASFVTTLAIV